MNQKLNCYRILVDVAKAMPEMIARFPKYEIKHSNQLRSAMSSALLNLCEGNGRYHTKERNKFFNYSMGSISEITGGIEYASAFGYINSALAQSTIDHLNKAYYMIRKLKK